MALFYNYSTQKFTHTWGGVPYSFEPGSVSSGVIISDDGQNSLTLNNVLAEFFAKHLADFVMNTPAMNINFDKDGRGTDGFPMKYNITNLEMLKQRALNAPDVVMPLPAFSSELPIASVTPVVEPVIETVIEEAPKKKMGRPPKVKEEASPSPEAEFEGV